MCNLSKDHVYGLMSLITGLFAWILTTLSRDLFNLFTRGSDIEHCNHIHPFELASSVIGHSPVEIASRYTVVRVHVI